MDHTSAAVMWVTPVESSDRVIGSSGDRVIGL